MATFCAPWTDCWKDTTQEERHKLMCASKDASMELLTKRITSKKCKKLKVAGKNDVKQEDKRPLVAVAHQATHTALAEIMRLSQEDEDFEVVLFGEGDNYEVDFAEGGKMSPFTLTMEKILVYCHEHGIPITFFIFKAASTTLTYSAAFVKGWQQTFDKISADFDQNVFFCLAGDDTTDGQKEKEDPMYMADKARLTFEYADLIIFVGTAIEKYWRRADGSLTTGAKHLTAMKGECCAAMKPLVDEISALTNEAKDELIAAILTTSMEDPVKVAAEFTDRQSEKPRKVLWSFVPNKTIAKKKPARIIEHIVETLPEGESSSAIPVA